MSRSFAFVSRHTPTQSQIGMALEKGIELKHVGDRDAFAFSAAPLIADGFEGVVVVHPWAALQAFIGGLAVGVFNNANRAPLGMPPQFEATEFHVREQSHYHCDTCANSCGEFCGR